MVRSLRLSPTNKVGQACERVRLLWLPREACFDPLGESRRHRGVCLDVAEYGVRSAVETTSAMVMLAFELSLARGRLKSRRLVMQVTAWWPTSQKASRNVS